MSNWRQGKSEAAVKSCDNIADMTATGWDGPMGIRFEAPNSGEAPKRRSLPQCQFKPASSSVRRSASNIHGFLGCKSIGEAEEESWLTKSETSSRSSGSQSSAIGRVGMP